MKQIKDRYGIWHTVKLIDESGRIWIGCNEWIHASNVLASR